MYTHGAKLVLDGVDKKNK